MKFEWTEWTTTIDDEAFAKPDDKMRGREIKFLIKTCYWIKKSRVALGFLLKAKDSVPGKFLFVY